jgi:hypothetical protein
MYVECVLYIECVLYTECVLYLEFVLYVEYVLYVECVRGKACEEGWGTVYEEQREILVSASGRGGSGEREVLLTIKK